MLHGSYGRHRVRTHELTCALAGSARSRAVRTSLGSLSLIAAPDGAALCNGTRLPARAVLPSVHCRRRSGSHWTSGRDRERWTPFPPLLLTRFILGFTRFIPARVKPCMVYLCVKPVGTVLNRLRRTPHTPLLRWSWCTAPTGLAVVSVQCGALSCIGQC